ncbi:MAG: hypothetical protein JNJ57_09625 [Saprospiraceae bacterium]|nr:hypothetical protein [Saprospiraceae bacterium]
MKKYQILAALLLSGLAFYSCKDPVETGIDFDMTFTANFDGQQLEVDKIYPLGTLPINFQRFRLYMSDITLLRGTEEIRISEVEYLDFTPSSSATNLSVTPKIVFKNVPEGSYDGIRIGYGVKPELNAKRPSDFPAGTPLAIEDDYWLGWKSYIFMVLDGRGDSDNDSNMDFGFSYHCGSDPVYREFTYQQHIHVEKDHPGLQIAFDVRRFLLNDDNSPYDILANRATSNEVSDTRVAEEIMGRFDSVVTMKQ